jgi:inward rectifier potassium channel
MKGKKNPRRVIIDDREILTHGLPHSIWQNLYHYCMTASWPRFFASMASLFLLLNFFFAGLYRLGENPIANLLPQNYLGYFFFSVETVATVGYGDMHPQTLYGHFISTIEIFIGLTSIALITGVMFARFSRPRAMILFARRAVIGQFDGQLTLTLRVANARQNVINEAAAKLRLLRRETTLEGRTMLRLHDLHLVREQQPVFQLGWIIMHRIGVDSPLYGQTPEQLEESEAVLILTIEGMDETTRQTMGARYNYRHGDIAWGHHFVDTYCLADDGSEHIDYNKFHDVEPQ